MKIDRPSDASPPPPPSAVDALATRADRGIPATGIPTTAPSTKDAAPAPQADSVQLSAASRSIGAITGTDTDVRTDKVEALRMQIEAGQFHVDAHKVADRMIAEAAELLETIVSVPK